MSHLKERPQKNCLNCNAEVHGKYCHICGQENIEPVETAWHLITHFLQDITHFDGKFFSTLKYLFFKPGFLSGEYKAGRRTNFLNPIRMYVFTSAVFFLVFFSLNEDNNKIINISYGGQTAKQIVSMDSTAFLNFSKTINNGKPMSREQFLKYKDSADKEGGLHFTSSRYKTRAAYDAVLRSGKKDHNWLQRQLVYKEIEMNKKYNNDQNLIVKAFVHNLTHSFPQMFFVSLPLFAFLLKVLYFRRKEFYYASHIIFAIHLYVFVFIQLLILIGLSQLNEMLNWSFIAYLKGFLIAFMFYYEYKSMRNFYRQRRAKTIFKFILLNLFMLIVIGLLFMVFTFFSLLKI